MRILIILFVIVAFAFHDLVPVYRSRKWKLFGTYVSIMVLIFFVEILISFNVSIPSPAVFITKLVTLVFGQHLE
jgi:hypothetical protein